MQDKYKLCKRAGLEVLYFCRQGYKTQGEWIYAADVEKMLEGAPVVYGHKNKYDIFEWGQYSDEQMMVEGPGLNDTHTARLVMMEPIAKDAAESLLREIVSRWNPEATDSLIDRAKRLLEGK